jgi:two-component system nitrogen regulation response regulator GlnG
MPPAKPPRVDQSDGSNSLPEQGGATSRILVIEDDHDIVETIELILRSDGHDVKSTTHGKDALRLVELLNPDLVITDVIMPEIDTLDAIGELRRTYPALKIIAISGNPHLLTLASKHGANQVLAKPFSLNKLKALVKLTLQ